MRVVLAIMWLVLPALTACGGDADRVVVTDADSGSELTVSSGDEVEVRLESNPSTGYSWQLDTRTIDSFADVRSSDYEATGDDGDRVGSAGTEVFIIEITGRGAGVLRLEYLRPFDELPIPERIVEYIIRADGAPWPPDDS